MRFGYWMPVFGGWLRNITDEGMEASWDYVKRLTQRSEETGWDLTLIAELNINDIKGVDQPALDAWSTAAALAARFLYAIEVESSGDSFDLCPADACVAQPGRKAIGMTAVTPAPHLIEAAERIAKAAGLDLGGIEVMIDDRDGTPRFYDINAMSNYVADPLKVLGWDPHERLIDYLETLIAERQAA